MIAIIPVKSESSRLPRKNFLKIGGIPLWERSVKYALMEGLDPVVSTDSEEVDRACFERYEDIVRVVIEDVDDSDMRNCISGVLDVTDESEFILLQPTSPLRPRGLTELMMKYELAYTCKKIKLIGNVNFNGLDVTIIQGRAQDAATWVYQFDGSILLSNRDVMENAGLITNRSEAFVQGLPYSLQVDTLEDFFTIKAIHDNEKSPFWQDKEELKKALEELYDA